MTKMVKNEYMNQKWKILKYMIYLSLTNDGIPKEQYDQLTHMFVMMYGYQEMITIMNLNDAGLLKFKDQKDTKSSKFDAIS